jgi:hypothetical protein
MAGRAAKNASAEHLIKVGQDQGIAPVVDLLRSTEETVQQGAAAALWSLSVTTENKIKIVERGGLPLLIRMLRSEDEGSQEQAAGCLYSLSVLAENKLNIVQEGGLAPLVGLCEYRTWATLRVEDILKSDIYKYANRMYL